MDRLDQPAEDAHEGRLPGAVGLEEDTSQVDADRVHGDAHFDRDVFEGQSPGEQLGEFGLARREAEDRREGGAARAASVVEIDDGQQDLGRAGSRSDRNRVQGIADRAVSVGDAGGNRGKIVRGPSLDEALEVRDEGSLDAGPVDEEASATHAQNVAGREQCGGPGVLPPDPPVRIDHDEGGATRPARGIEADQETFGARDRRPRRWIGYEPRDIARQVVFGAIR